MKIEFFRNGLEIDNGKKTFIAYQTISHVSDICYNVDYNTDYDFLYDRFFGKYVVKYVYFKIYIIGSDDFF